MTISFTHANFAQGPSGRRAGTQQILGYNNTTFGARIQNLRPTNFSKIRSQKTVTLHSPWMKPVQLTSTPLFRQNGPRRQTKKPVSKDGLFCTRSEVSPVWHSQTAEKENSRRRSWPRPTPQKQEEKAFTVAVSALCCNCIVTLLSPICNTFL